MEVTIYSHFKSKTWTGDVPREALGDNPNEALFRMFNRVDPDDGERLTSMGYDLPSLSVDDRVEYDGLVWEVQGVGFALVSSTRLEQLQADYDRLNAARQRAIKYLDECPDGDPRLVNTHHRLGNLSTMIRNVEERQDEAVDWFQRKQEGVKVAALLDPLPVGSEFRVNWNMSFAYSALYRKNAEGLWDQVEGTCQKPHVINMEPEHIGFVMGEAVITAALGEAGVRVGQGTP